MKRWTRETRETRVTVGVALSGGDPVDAGASPGPQTESVPPGAARRAAISIATGRPFFDHMLVTLAHHAGLCLEVEATGDLPHHLLEDTAATLGASIRATLPEARARYGAARVAMDDALVDVTLDTGGRFFYEGPLPSRLYDHVLRSLAENAGWTLHVEVRRGRDRHHVVEAAFKALGLALRAAAQPWRDGGPVFSTKGRVQLVAVEEGGAAPRATPVGAGGEGR